MARSPEAIWQPVRLHVAAKRYRCGIDAQCHTGLCSTSRQNPALQGGPFDDKQVEAFLRMPYAQDAITLRRLDVPGKDPAIRTPEPCHFLPLLERLLQVDRHQARARLAG